MKPWTFKRWLAAIFSVTALSLVGYVSTSTHPKLAASASGPSLVVSPVPFYPTFVFRPGGVTSGNTYTTWAALMAAVALIPGRKDITFDNSLGQCHITTGGPWNIDQCIFWSAKLDNTGNANRQVIIDDGATLTANIFEAHDVVWLQEATSAVPFVVPANQRCTMRMWSGFIQTSGAGAKPLFQVPNNGGSLSVECWSVASVSGPTAGGGPVITVDVGANPAIVRLYDHSSLGASALAGAGNYTVQQTAGATASGTQAGVTGVITTTLVSLASVVAYAPAVGGNWQPAPTVVGAALDQLAAPNFVQAVGNTGTGSGTVTAVTGNIAKLRSGKVSVAGVATGLSSAGTTVTVSLLRDSTPILALPAITTLLTTGFAIPINFIDTLPDTSNHTYTVKAVAAAGNIVTGTGGDLIQASEY